MPFSVKIAKFNFFVLLFLAFAIGVKILTLNSINFFNETGEKILLKSGSEMAEIGDAIKPLKQCQYESFFQDKLLENTKIKFTLKSLTPECEEAFFLLISKIFISFRLQQKFLKLISEKGFSPEIERKKNKVLFHVKTLLFEIETDKKNNQKTITITNLDKDYV